MRTKEAARPILEAAAKDGALVVFTVVSPELREYIHAQSYELKVEALDLIGSLIGKLSTFLDRQPINMPSGMLPLTEEYFRRIEAVEFAVKSDDGKEPRNFKKADLVLVGVSRTCKTPLSTLLAQRGLKVANQPIVLGVDAPAGARRGAAGPRRRPDHRARPARRDPQGAPQAARHADRRELRPARAGEGRSSTTRGSIFAEHPQWPVIDVTGRAIEETAVIILESLKERDDAPRTSATRCSEIKKKREGRDATLRRGAPNPASRQATWQRRGRQRPRSGPG